MKPSLQFRVLYREFLFRMVDLDVLSAQALGDSHKLIGRFVALLIYISIWTALGAFSFASAKLSPGAALAMILVTEHLLIASTMLVVGLFAVLSWDSTFPSRRDVLVLAPLPVRPRTMFLAKVAAVGTSLALTIGLLHAAMGLVWPAAFEMQIVPQNAPILTFEPTPSSVSAAELQLIMNRDLQPAIARGEVGGTNGAGLMIGVLKHGNRRIFSYGNARTDSLFEIGSLTKTFTALILARMVEQGKLRLDEPIRSILPTGTLGRPRGDEITLLDLATHYAGLPGNPPYFHPNDPQRPFGDDTVADLYGAFARHGAARHPEPRFAYSNFGFAVLGRALVERSGRSYADLLQQMTQLLGLHDTVLELPADQQARYAEGHSRPGVPTSPMHLDAMAPAGGIRSTAADILTYLEANLHPEQAGPLASAIRATHRLRAETSAGQQIGLAWQYREENQTFFHDGRTSGFNSFAFFSPRHDCAAVMLLDQGSFSFHSLDLLGDHVWQRLTGQPAVVLDTTHISAAKGVTGLVRWYAAYWFTMLASGIFIYSGVLALQGVTAQLLPRRLFLRVSAWLQMAAFCLFLTVYFAQPVFGSMDLLDSPKTRQLLVWLPSYWFLGLFHQLNGSEFAPLVPLARRAWIGLAVVLFGAAVGYALSYVRTLKQIVEEPDIVPGVRTFNWLPPFGDRIQTALARFAVRSLARSRQHRMILAFYLGVGFAVTIFLLKGPTMQNSADTPPLAATVVMLALSIVGTRVVFAFPLDLRANWIFQAIGPLDPVHCLTASRRALMCVGALPVWLGATVLCFRLWPWQQAAGHAVLLALLASILCDLCMLQFRKIPFACSYLPGKSPVHLVFLGSLGLIYGVMLCVKLERSMLQSASDTLVMLVPFALAAVAAHVAARYFGADEELRFEESIPPAVQQLRLQG